MMKEICHKTKLGRVDLFYPEIVMAMYVWLCI